MSEMRHADVEAETNRITGLIVDACLEVHRQLGPGLLESTYSTALVRELQLRGLTVRREVPLVVEYKDVLLPGYRLDLVVEDRVIVEVKALAELPRVAFAQLRTYLRLSGMEVGILVNFDAEWLKGNLHRVVESSARPPPLRASASGL